MSRIFWKLSLVLILQSGIVSANNIPKVNDTLKNKLVGSAYKIEEYLGAGGFGLIYTGREIDTGVEVAIKLEKKFNSKPSRLKREAMVYQRCNGTAGFPTFHWQGDYENYSALVIQRLGKSIKKAMEEIPIKTKLKKLSAYAPQMIERLQYLHSKKFLHHDVSPGNFVMGRGAESSVVFVIDFGSALYHRPGRAALFTADRSRHIRTTPYCSAGAMMGYDYGPVDDLVGLGYSLLGMSVGLPWGNIRDKQEILRLKLDTSIEELCDDWKACKKYFRYLEKLNDTPAAIPDYDYLKSLFGGGVVKKGNTKKPWWYRMFIRS